VDEEICAIDEFDMPQVLPCDIPAALQFEISRSAQM
jgi:hypothetical protein